MNSKRRTTVTMKRQSFIFLVVVTSLTVTAVTSLASGDPDSRCVSLKKCESIQWLINNLSRFPSDKRSTIVRKINGLQCGVTDSSEMMILCPKTISDNLLGAEQSERAVFGSRSMSTDCIGSLKVFHLNVSRGNLLNIRAFSRNGHRDLAQIFNPESVVRLKVEGNCCWNLFSRKDYRGASLKVAPGFDELPFPVQSVSKVAC